MAHFMFARLLADELIEEEMQYQARLDRRRIRDMTDPFSISNREFIANFRLSKEACLYLLNELNPHFQAGRYSSRLPNHLRFLSALHFFAVGSYQRSAGSCVWSCLSQPMISRAINEVCNLLIRYCMKTWIHFPRNMQEKRAINERFLLRFRMPSIIGVVDGTHVAIVKPHHENEHAYVNRRGYHSINVQIICDESMSIISILAIYPGSTHDAFIWRNSRVGMTMRANYENGDHTSRIMGDSGYPCLPWMLTPVNNPRSAEERRFNIRFKSTRSLVERCIGLLKGRFRCLLKHRTLHYKPEKAARIIMSCAILHNVAINYRLEEAEPMWDDIDLEPALAPQDQAADVRYRQLGQQSRRQYINNNF